MLKFIAAISLIGNLMAVLAKMKGGGEKRELTNDPLRVEGVRSFATDDELTRHSERDDAEHKRLERLFYEEIGKLYTKVDHTRESILSAGQQREQSLRHDIGKLTQLVGELRGAVEQMNRRKA